MVMKHSKKSITVKIVLVLALGVIVYLGLSLRNTQFLNRDPLGARPSGKNASIFDYAGILEDVAPSTENYLSIIDELDAQLLSGGAGAKRQLTEYREEEFSALGHNYPAGRTPDEAWQMK